MGGSRALRPVANSETFGRHEALGDGKSSI